jgi:hypothetical protein
MRSTRWWVRSGLFAVSFVAPLAVAALARAEGTCGDQTCPKNWECKQATATDGVACAPGEACPEPETTTFEYCAPLSCTSDADCAADMVCYSETNSVCADPPPCAKGADCAAPADGSCTPVTRSACVPRYVPPCETADDCGAGFTCEPEACGCSSGSSGSAGGGTPSAGGGSDGNAGSDPVPPADGGAAEPAPADGKAAPPAPAAADGGAAPSDDVAAPDCGCPATPTKVCRLTVTACSTASDCPAGFTCEANPQGVCSSSSDGKTDCAPVEPARICAPPYVELVGGASGPARGEDSGGTPTHAGDPPTSGEGSNSGSTAGPKDPSATAKDPNAATPESSNEGCAVARSPRPDAGASGLAALAVVGALGAFAARRKRAE